MFDIDCLEDKKPFLAEKLKGCSTEGEERKELMKHISSISKMNGIQWEHEKLEILELSKISETKLDKIRTLASNTNIVVNEEEERAKEKLGRVFCSQTGKGYSYMILEDNKLRSIPQQEMTPIVKLLCGDDKMMESDIYQRIHSKMEIKKITTHIMPSGKSSYSMMALDGGGFESVCNVSIGEMLRNQLKKVSQYEVTEEFKGLVFEHYRYMIDIYEYALALKFAFDKTNCIWIREKSDTGKTFFLGAVESKDYVFITDGEIKENDFVGDGPERWGKMLFFYIDEATKFSKEMKTAYLAYRMNYGGRVELNMPLRVLGSDNEITDLTNGVDRQIQNRVINIHYKGSVNLRAWLDERGIDATTAQIMWQKIILNHILDLMDEWGKEATLQDAAAKKIREFKQKYKNQKMKGLDEATIELFETLIYDISDESGNVTKSVHRNKRDFKDFLIKHKDGYLIKSPKTFMSMLFDEYAPEKKKAFFKKYPNNDCIANVFDDSYTNRRLENGQCKAIYYHMLPKKG